MKAFKKYFLTVLLLILTFTVAVAFTACKDGDDGDNSPKTERIYWGTLVGTVVDYNTSPVKASPVEGVTVKSGDEVATTDENGHYSIKIYDNGATVTFEKEGRFTQKKTLKSSSFRTEELTYDFIMYISARVEGTVKNSSGTALSGVAVEIGIQKTTTDSQGKFVFDEVIATDMIITATYNDKSVIKPVYTEDMITGNVSTEIIIG